MRGDLQVGKGFATRRIVMSIAGGIVVEMVPTNILANLMGYSRRQLFEIRETEWQSPDVGNLFNS
jgi:hypothetical protein